MEDLELKDIWRSYDKKIAEAHLLNAQSWALNFRCFETIQQQKAASKLNALARFKTGAVILGILWILFLAVLVWGNKFENPYFGVSVSIIMLFSAYAVVVYIKHIILIRRLNYDGNIIDTQKKLSALQASTFQSTRILWLQMPFHTTWFWHSSWIVYSSARFWLINFPITLLFTLLAIYLYRNITAENMHKKWVRSLMMSGPEYKDVVRSIEFLDEIEEFKKELI
ncbi:MAG: hypothetical protein JWQ30_1073 [Sediminibacterium sp.]|nr:hypothetical protein [Sediminibacterium sp.]